MFCGSNNNIKATVNDKVIQNLRNFNENKLEIKLNDYKLEFNELTGDWKSFFIFFILF